MPVRDEDTSESSLSSSEDSEEEEEKGEAKTCVVTSQECKEMEDPFPLQLPWERRSNKKLLLVEEIV